MAISELISLMRQGTIQGSKSTALTPLNLLMVTLMAGLLLGSKMGLPDWIIGLLAATIVGLGLCFIWAFAYLVVKDPDKLRTERFTLTKLAIEQHLRGDDLAGLTESIQVIDTLESSLDKALPTPGAKPAKAPSKKPKASEGQES